MNKKYVAAIRTELKIIYSAFNFGYKLPIFYFHWHLPFLNLKNTIFPSAAKSKNFAATPDPQSGESQKLMVLRAEREVWL